MKGVSYFVTQFYERFISLKSKNFPVQELMYYYSLYIVFILTSIATVTNTLIGLPAEINIFSITGIGLSSFLYWLGRYKKRLRLSQIIFVVYLFISFNFLWFLSDGSSGSTLLFVQGFLLLFIFFSSGRMQKIIVSLMFLNMLALFGVEYFCRDWIQVYESPAQRTLDIFVMFLIFFVLELPILAYAKRAIITERNHAIASESMKTQYFLGLSHEIRTPMNAILGFSELLADDDLEPEYRKEYIDLINNNGRILLNLINNVLSFSKLENHDEELKTSIINAQKLCQFLLDNMRSHFPVSGNVAFRMEVPQQEIVFECDSLMIYQVLSNIIFNAIKFTEKGEVVLGCSESVHHVTFSIADTGVGIPKEHQDTIFTRFQQSHQTLKSSAHQGAGLGLAICVRLVKLLQGKIWFESTVGKGTTFYVQVPKKYTREAK